MYRSHAFHGELYYLATRPTHLCTHQRLLCCRIYCTVCVCGYVHVCHASCIYTMHACMRTCMHMRVNVGRAPCGYRMLMCGVCNCGSRNHCLYMIVSRHTATLLLVQALSALYKLLATTTTIRLMQPRPILPTILNRVH